MPPHLRRKRAPGGKKEKAKDLEVAEEKAEGVEMGQKKLTGKNTKKKNYWI